MNRSFDYVINNCLNNSRSKENHRFSKANRFTTFKPPTCNRASYDLNTTMMASQIPKKLSVTAKEQRFRFRSSLSPSPAAYTLNDFAQTNKLTKRGPAFTHADKMNQINKQKYFPGPGAYQPKYQPENQLSYTMRSRIKTIDHSNKLGPGEYRVNEIQSLTKSQQIYSKYKDEAKYRIGKAQRFKEKDFQTISPGPAAYTNQGFKCISRVKTEVDEAAINPEANYTFTKQIKKPSYIKSNPFPGPGAYYQFSQFAEKSQRIQETLNKLEGLTKRSKK